MSKPKAIYVCPACGGTKTSKLRWSGETGVDGEDTYNGWWIECLACALQGPKLVWDRMAKRRADMQRALGITDVMGMTGYQQGYMTAIESFGQKMFRELRANDPKKGDFLTWKPSDGQAQSELEHHFTKLFAAIHNRKKQQITEYCADLANIVMAIDANLGAK